MFRVIFCGNLGADAETQSYNGRDYLTFRVAHSRRFTDARGVEHEQTTWCTCWMSGNFSNVAQYLVKGQKVVVVGDAELRIYDSAKFHCKMAGISCNVDSLELCGSPLSESSKAGTTQQDGSNLSDGVSSNALP